MAIRETIKVALSRGQIPKSPTWGFHLVPVKNSRSVTWEERKIYVPAPWWEIAVSWYHEDDIAYAIQQKATEIPRNVRSEEFAKWLTHQYRLALAKGVQLGRSGAEDHSRPNG